MIIVTHQNQARGVISFGEVHAPCALGKYGVTDDKREGDKKTPLGIFSLRRLWYRPDRMTRPDTHLPCYKISPYHGWSDDPTDPLYNRPLLLPHKFSPEFSHEFHHEQLWREDNLYNIFLEIAYNDAPPRAGSGSAIFLHLAKPDLSPTQGCVAVELDIMQKIIAYIDPATQLHILRAPNKAEPTRT